MVGISFVLLGASMRPFARGSGWERYLLCLYKLLCLWLLLLEQVVSQVTTFRWWWDGMLAGVISCS